MQAREENSKIKMLWVTPKWPFPATDGARIATTQLLKQLSARGVHIHLVSIVPDDEVFHLKDAKESLGMKEVTLIRKPKVTRFMQLYHFLKSPWIPVTFSSYASNEIAKKIKSSLENQKFDLIVYDGLHAAAWKFLSSEKVNLKTAEAYRAHNVESEIWFRASSKTNNPIKKIFLSFQGKLVENFEKKVVRESAFIYPVSDTDANKFGLYRFDGTMLTLPIGMEIKEISKTFSSKKYPDTKKNILFVGKLDWAPNRDGLKWILEKVWPKVIENADDITLTIVGSGDRGWLEEYKTLKGLNIIGQVDDVGAYYEDCMATIVPVFYGSGTRVKAIESSLYGKMCISTKLGVEGVGLIDGKSYQRVEAEKDWIHALSFFEVPLAHQMGHEAFLYAKKAFDPKVIADQFLKSLVKDARA